MEYDWAPCQNCGWKVPTSWETAQEDEEGLTQKPTLAKPNAWVQITAWVLLIATVVWLLSWIRW